jgi:hypothetical protein
VSFVAGSAALFFHLRFVHVARAALQLAANSAFVLSEPRPVIVVELLDDLECPPPVENVPADEVPLEPVCCVAVSRCPQFVAGFTEGEVGAAHQLVKRVERPPGPFHPLQRLGDRPDGLDGGAVKFGHGDHLPTESESRTRRGASRRRDVTKVKPRT